MSNVISVITVSSTVKCDSIYNEYKVGIYQSVNSNISTKIDSAYILFLEAPP